MVIATDVGSLGDWDTAQNELTDPTADGPRPVLNRALCDAAATTPGNIAIGIVSGAAGPTVLGKFCKPYWDEQGGGPTVEPPFEGGQCPGVAYTVRFTYSSPSGQQIVSYSGVGPVLAVRQEPSGNGCGGQQPPDREIYTIGATFSNVVRGPNTACVVNGAIDFVILRGDGQPDNCGNPPPVVVPPPNYPNPRPFNAPTTVNIGGDDYDVTIGGPQTDINGDVYFPINIGGDVVVNIPASDPTATPSLPDNPPSTEGPPVDSAPGDGSVDDEVPPEEEGFVAGYCWQVIPLPSTPPGIPRSDPIVWPNVIGNLRLRYKVGGTVVSGPNVEIDSERGCLFPPLDKLPVVACTGNINTAYGTLRLRKVRFGG